MNQPVRSGDLTIRTCGELPRAAADRWRDREALTFRDRRYSFREIADEVDRLARGFIAIGIHPGDKVAIWLVNCPEWIFAMFALARIGAIHVPVNTRFRTADVEYVLRQSDASALITHDVSGPVDYLGMVRELVPELGSTARPRTGAPSDAATFASPRLPELRRVVVKSDQAHAGTCRWSEVLDAGRDVDEATVSARAAAVKPDDTLLIMYTSGTTGFPKGVMRTHASMIGNHADRLRRLRATERDVFVNYLPLFHVFGYVDGPLGSMLAGYRQILTETFDPDEVLDLVGRERGTLIHGFETHLKALCDAQDARPRDLSTLRTGLWALGAASATPLAYRALTTLAPLRPLAAFGMTEIGANVSISHPEATDAQRCETSGAPCEGLALRIVDPETGKDQPTGVPGEILARSAWAMQGYYRMPEETAKALDAEGWFHTGDMGLLRADGYLRFIGRYKDILKVGGENVDPVEVEAHLAQHPGVAQVAVVSYPDPRLAEIPVAFVVPAAGAVMRSEELIAACRGRIASFKIPRHVVFVDALPMTASGKVQKVTLREEARRRLAPAPTP